MRGAGAASKQSSVKAVLWATIGAGLSLVLIANLHLVYVAVVSQPDCVAHMQAGEGAAEPGKFSAARSSCTPPMEVRGGR